MNPGSQTRHDNGRSVYLCDGVLVHKCILADSREDGAKVRIDASRVSLPSGVVLVDPHTGYSHMATVVWRSEDEIGVRFVQPGMRYRVLRSAADLAWNANACSRRVS